MYAVSYNCTDPELHFLGLEGEVKREEGKGKGRGKRGKGEEREENRRRRQREGIEGEGEGKGKQGGNGGEVKREAKENKKEKGIAST